MYHILAADDDVAILQMIKDVLEQAGYQVTDLSCARRGDVPLVLDVPDEQ